MFALLSVVVFFAFNRGFASALSVFIFGCAAQQHFVYRDFCTYK
jgi:hypothetical protein